MSKFALVLSLLLSFNLFAQDISEERAEELFEMRGEAATNAQAASDMYEKLAAGSTDKAEKATFFWKASEATYYVGRMASKKKEKIAIHGKGYEIAQKAISMLEGNIEDADQEEALAQALYFWGANKGKWGEAKGIISSLGQWPDLRAAMEKIINMGYADIESYGANRILGRAYFKIPAGMGGNRELSEKYLVEALEETFDEDYGVSTHGLNNIYLADFYQKKNRDKACDILKKFVQVDPEELDFERVPETKQEIVQAQEKIKDLKCN
jgi:tetratricopeptide (TPR) repeat protein